MLYKYIVKLKSTFKICLEGTFYSIRVEKRHPYANIRVKKRHHALTSIKFIDNIYL